MTGVRLYRLLLHLYPAELQREFGGEMLEVFAEDLRNAIRYSGARGAARVWRCTTAEFARIALPAHAENRIVAVPCILFCLNELLVTLPLLLTHPAPMAFIARAALAPSLLAALTSVVVVKVGKTSPFCLLSLGPGSCSKFTI